MARARFAIGSGTLILAACLSACAARAAAPSATATADAPRRVRAGEPFTLAPSERAAPEGLGVEIEFRGVESDSRCPRDVTCIWAGDASVAIVARGNGSEAVLQLHTNLEPGSATVDGARIELVGVTPYPVSTSKIERKDYRATLRATAAEGGQGTTS